MQRKLTITVDERVYDGPYSVVGRRKHSLEAAYREMALDEARETGALEWAKATMGDVADETR